MILFVFQETYLNSETPSNDTPLELPGYNLFRSDHPSNNKRGGVCIYYKSTLPLKTFYISNLDECVNFEVSIASKICRFTQLSGSPSEKQVKFQEFKVKSRNESFLTVMIGDFSAKSRN